MTALEPVILTSRWFIRSGCEVPALAALTKLAATVRQEEPDTWVYLVHVTPDDDLRLQSLPPSPPRQVVFFETYRDHTAFEQHVGGPVFTSFVRDFGKLFVQNASGEPYTSVEFMKRETGFVRPQAITAEGKRALPPVTAVALSNEHPAVMFEVIAKDQAKALSFYSAVFGWSYDEGTGGFAYVKFPTLPRALLGGIGQSSSEVGFEPGHTFYIQVSGLEATIAAALVTGGSEHMPVTSVDGYRFAMIRDPEGNPIGLIEPF